MADKPIRQAQGDDTVTTKTSLVVRRVFETDPETLWEIWNDPAKVKEYHLPGDEGHSVPVAEADVRVGGKYKISMKDPEGNVYTVTGEFLEVERPHKLVYTWNWQHDPSEKSVVTVEFKPYDDDTELVLTHQKLSGPESVKNHAAGWESIVKKLEDLLTKT